MARLSPSTNFKDILSLTILSIIWGSSFILIKKGLDAFSPMQVAALRITIAALAFTPILVLQFRKVKRKHIGPLIVAGFLGSGIPAYCFALAETKVSSSIAGILNSLTPVFTLVLGLLFFKLPPKKLQIAGISLGLIGAISLLTWGHRFGAQSNFIFGLVAVIGTICYATSVNTVKNYLQDLDPLLISVMAFTIIGIPYGVYLLGSDITSVFQTNPQAWKAFGYICILSLIGTFYATIIFYRMVQRTNAVFAASVAYTIPIVALIWGWLDGEAITLLHFLSMGLIVYGVYLIRKV